MNPPPHHSRRKLDLAGQRFNRWTVLDYSERNHAGMHWLCRCDCGTEKLIFIGNLGRGASKSCGCLRIEVTSANAKKLWRANNSLTRSSRKS
jgi:hypothetical protein